MYINTTTQTQHSESEIRALYPNTSFPQPFIAPEGYALVFPAPQPAHDAVTQRVQEIAPVLTVKGTWEQQWQVMGLFATQAEKDAAIAANQARVNTAHSDGIKAQIAALEATQPRALREATLGMTGAVARLQSLEGQISTLRAQLK